MDVRSPSPPITENAGSAERVLHQGILQFQNQGLISKYKSYWAQVVEQQRNGSVVVIFRILRGKEEIEGERLKDEEIKRQVILYEEGENAGQGFYMPKIILAEKVTDFTMKPDDQQEFKLRVESSGVREQWMQVFTQYCDFPG